MTACVDTLGMLHRAECFRRSSFSRVSGLFFLFVLLTAFQGGCARPLAVPIETELLAGTEQPHRVLLIYLPGNGDAADAFKRNGLIPLLRERNISADISGVVLLGAYAGERKILSEIEQAGGLRTWNSGTMEEKDWDRQL